MPIMRLQHTYNHLSGMAEDAVVNTFHFSSGSGGAAVNATTGAQVAELVLDFYDESHTGQTNQIQTYIAEASMAASRHTIKVYDLDDDEPRVPVYQVTTNNGTANNAVAPGPAEVALCLSYRSTIESGTPMARRRGRIYIGPLNASVGEVDVAGHFRPLATVRNNLVMAGRGLQVTARTAGWPWVVRHGGGSVDGEGTTLAFSSEIFHCWCDDAFDTQRRRGPKPTTRTSVTF
jgi:hypothetical protein